MHDGIHIYPQDHASIMFGSSASSPSNPFRGRGALVSLLLLAVSLALVLGAVVLCVESEDGHAAVGDTFTADGITYKVMTVPEGENPGTVQVGDGSECAIDSSRATVVIPDTVVNGGESYDVIKIADEAFYKCNS